MKSLKVFLMSMLLVVVWTAPAFAEDTPQPENESKNLIQNPGFESDFGGWNLHNNPTRDGTARSGEGAFRGKRGKGEAGKSAVWQDFYIDHFAGLRGLVAAGRVTANLSGWLRGWSDHFDAVWLEMRFEADTHISNDIIIENHGSELVGHGVLKRLV